MADDPTRTQALRAAGFAAEVDTQDPPGKVTVVFDTGDFDDLIKALVKGDPATVVKARADGVAEGRDDAEAAAIRNARRVAVLELVAERRLRGADGLEEKLLQMARSEAVRIDGPPQPPPGVHNAMLGDGPAAEKKGRTRGR